MVRANARCRVVSCADTFQLMTIADAIVSMGGYNSVCEALAVARPLVIVPRETHKVEQTIRAEILASHGVARCVHARQYNGFAKRCLAVFVGMGIQSGESDLFV